MMPELNYGRGIDAAAASGRGYVPGLRQQGAIPDIPLIIIGSEVLDTNGNAALDGLQAARHETLSALAAQSAQGEFIIAEGSTHNVLIDRPDVVLDAIESVLAAGR